MNPELQQLQPYPFEKLRALFADVTPNNSKTPISFGIGEPKHPSPEFVIQTLRDELKRLANYPATAGIPELRQAIADWLTKRFKLNHVDVNSQVLPVNGTREAIFSFTQAAFDRSAGGTVISPNPFYQIYEGAAYLAGAELQLLPCLEENGFKPDFNQVSAEQWQRCQLLFLCSPGNPTGAVIQAEELKQLIALSDEYNFIIASDECYSEIYFDESKPPIGLLQACAELGRDDYRNCVVFHSLSKRSNLPGLRSGFIAGDAKLLGPYLQYRTYHGCALPVQHQYASIAAWQDEQHVQDNRAAYRQKFDAVLEILQPVMDIARPDASFYLWPKTPIAETDFAKALYQQQNLTVLPGSFLARPLENGKPDSNPGHNRIRMALVAELAECIDGAERIRTCIQDLN